MAMPSLRMWYRLFLSVMILAVWECAVAQSEEIKDVATKIDSVYPGLEVVTDSFPDTSKLKDTRRFRQAKDNAYVPLTVFIDPLKPIGSIPVESGMSPSGARTYNIPLKLPEGINGHQPKLSLAYNSQQGDGIAGFGWHLDGLPCITRIGALAGGAGAAAAIAIMPAIAPTLGGIWSMSSAQVGMLTGSGLIPGAVFGGTSGLVEGFITGSGNSLFEGNSFGQSMKSGASGALSNGIGGALTGGAMGMYNAAKSGQNVLFGNLSSINSSQNPLIHSANSVNSPPNNDYSEIADTRVYVGVDKNGVRRYVGITRQPLETRFYQHKSSGTIRSLLDFSEYNDIVYPRLKARILEQTIINEDGMMKYGGQLFNLRNEIAPKYWKKYGIKPFRKN